MKADFETGFCSVFEKNSRSSLLREWSSIVSIHMIRDEKEHLRLRVKSVSGQLTKGAGSEDIKLIVFIKAFLM